jgi:hypothetical protein
LDSIAQAELHLLAMWATLALLFAYAVPYFTYLNGSSDAPLADLLPQHSLQP